MALDQEGRLIIAPHREITEEKARALWVMLLINSIQQTLRRNDYLSRTAPLSPAMLIIVVSL